MDPNPIPGSHEELRSLLEENLKLSKQIQAATEKTRKYIFWGEVMSFVRLALIVIPLIFAFIYLKPLFDQTMQYAQQILGPGTLNQPDGSGDLMGIIKELREQGILPAKTAPTK